MIEDAAWSGFIIPGDEAMLGAFSRQNVFGRSIEVMLIRFQRISGSRVHEASLGQGDQGKLEVPTAHDGRPGQVRTLGE